MISLLLYNETNNITTQEVFLNADSFTEDEIRLNYRSSRTMKGNKRQDWYATYKKFNISFSMITEVDFIKLRAIIQKQSGKTMLVYNNTFYQVVHESDTLSDTPKWSSVKNCYVYDGSLALEEILYDLEELQQVDPVQFNYASGTYEYSIYLRMTTETLGSKIYYTIDGSDPTTSSLAYSEPVLISTTKTIKAKAVKANLLDSNITTGTYNIGILEPVISPTSTSSSLPISVSIEKNPLSQILSHKIFYTTDGSDPTSSSTEYSSSFPLMQSGTIIVKAIAYSDDLSLFSNVVSKTYVLNIANSVVYTPGAGTYVGSQVVNLSKVSPSIVGNIQYSLDDIAWTTGNSITITENSTLYTRINNDGVYTVTQSEIYNIQVLPVGFLDGTAPISSPTYSIDKSTTITLKTSQLGATVYYSTDGGINWGNGIAGTSTAELVVSTSLTILAYASKSNLEDSIQTSVETEVRVKPVIFTPNGRTNGDNFDTVTLSTSTTGAAIYYGFTSGSYPNPYLDSFTLTQDRTIYAIATKAGLTDSIEKDAAFTYKVATPTSSNNPGTYIDTFTESLQCITSSAEIRYTTDGSDPTESSLLYSLPISINKTMTLKARAYKSGMTNSDTMEKTFTLKVATPTLTPSTGTYYNPQTIVASCATPGHTIRYEFGFTDVTELSPLFSGFVNSLNETKTIQIRAFKGDMDKSDINTYHYNINVSPVIISPSSSQFSTTREIILSLDGSPSTVGATIYYTTDNTDPKTSSTKQTYSTPFTITETTIIRAVAYSALFVNPYSIESSRMYVKDTPTAPTKIEPNEIEVPAGTTAINNGYVSLQYPIVVHDIPVTQAMFNYISNKNPSRENLGIASINYPVEYITVYDAMDFCDRLSYQDGFSKYYNLTNIVFENNSALRNGCINSASVNINPLADGWRLPFDWEWMYLAKGGKGSDDFIFSGSDNASEVAVYNVSNITNVKTKNDNYLRIYDMSGLIKEIVYESPTPSLRGGCFFNISEYIRIDKEINSKSAYNGFSESTGFRVVRSNLSEEFINSFFVEVDSGTTQYSSPITINTDIKMMKTPITIGLFYLLTLRNPSRSIPPIFTMLNNLSLRIFKNPVENITWYDAIDFCNKLSEICEYEKFYTISDKTIDPITGSITNATVVQADITSNSGFRLPTSIEWLYCAQGGRDNSYITTYSGSNDLDQVGWFESNMYEYLSCFSLTPSNTKPVGMKEPNYLGLYDMSGNVWEFTTESNTNLVEVYGGAYDSINNSCNITSPIYNSSQPKSTKSIKTGFRICRSNI